MVAQTSTQIAREAPFMEDYRRRLLDSLYGGTDVYTQAEIDDPDFKGPAGAKAGDNNTTASYNTAVGHKAFDANTTGADNVAIGYLTLDANTTASYNTAVG